MKKFLFVYNASPEPGTETDQDWMNWFGTIGEKLVDVGNPYVSEITAHASSSHLCLPK